MGRGYPQDTTILHCFLFYTEASVFGPRVSRFVHRSMDCNQQKLHERQWALVMHNHQGGSGRLTQFSQTKKARVFFGLGLVFCFVGFVLFQMLLFGTLFCLDLFFVCLFVLFCLEFCVLFWCVNANILCLFNHQPNLECSFFRWKIPCEKTWKKTPKIPSLKKTKNPYWDVHGT